MVVLIALGDDGGCVDGGGGAGDSCGSGDKRDGGGGLLVVMLIKMQCSRVVSEHLDLNCVQICHLPSCVPTGSFLICKMGRITLIVSHYNDKRNSCL